jgi:hypothetical protein
MKGSSSLTVCAKFVKAGSAPFTAAYALVRGTNPSPAVLEGVHGLKGIRGLKCQRKDTREVCYVTVIGTYEPPLVCGL